jgi:hypothetical protein
MSDDDTKSDTSWAKIGYMDVSRDDDVRSNLSWDLPCSELSVGFPSACAQSNDAGDSVAGDSSWEILSDRNSGSWFDADMNTSFTSFEEALPLMSNTDCDVCSADNPCSRHTGTLFVDIIRGGCCGCALNVLRTCPEPSEFAAQFDSSGDSALSWAVYKSTSEDIKWLELVCQILASSPSDISRRSTSKFLPLHDAGWGGASSEVATVLCAALPTALFDVVQGQTPHQLGHYHSVLKKQRFAWTTPEVMMQDALELRNVKDWLQKLISIRWSNISQVASMCEGQIMNCFDVPFPIAKLVASFFKRKPRYSPYATCLASIPEHIGSNLVHPSRHNPPRRLHPPRGRALRARLPCLPIDEDEVSHLQELVSKSQGRCAGIERSRGRRCSFKKSMKIMDGQGSVHFILLHSVRTLPKEFRKVRQPKWPSKARVRRERDSDRQGKMHENSVFTDEFHW